MNQLTLDEPYLSAGYTEQDLLLTAFLASEPATTDAIEICVRQNAVQSVPLLQGLNAATSNAPGYEVVEFHPFEPVSKLTRAIVIKTAVEAPRLASPGTDVDQSAVSADLQGPVSTGQALCVAKGAPQVILQLCQVTDPAVQQAINSMAQRGLRALGVCRALRMKDTVSLTSSELHWELVGIISLLDPPRHDSASTIAECKEYGISVKMITGDAVLIAQEVARRMGMPPNILSPAVLHDADHDELNAIQLCLQADGFAQVLYEFLLHPH